MRLLIVASACLVASCVTYSNPNSWIAPAGADTSRQTQDFAHCRQYAAQQASQAQIAGNIQHAANSINNPYAINTSGFQALAAQEAGMRDCLMARGYVLAVSPSTDRSLRQAIVSNLSNQHGEAVHPRFAPDPAHQDWIDALRLGAEGTWTVVLNAGSTYRVVGVCDGDCTNVDMALFDAGGTLINVNTYPDDAPWIEFRPPQTGAYTAHLLLRACSTEPCYVGMRVLLQN